jgi:hypothetical protein
VTEIARLRVLQAVIRNVTGGHDSAALARIGRAIAERRLALTEAKAYGYFDVGGEAGFALGEEWTVFTTW